MFEGRKGFNVLNAQVQIAELFWLVLGDACVPVTGETCGGFSSGLREHIIPEKSVPYQSWKSGVLRVHV